jgi:hypothetical protein
MNDRLEIKVIGAQGLVEVEGGACNPFAVVRCNQDIEQTMALLTLVSYDKRINNVQCRLQITLHIHIGILQQCYSITSARAM